MSTPRRIAIVHEWFTSMRGGEKVVEALCELFPQADIFTLLHVRGSVSPVIEKMPIHTSFIQHLPFAKSAYRYYLPLFPLAVKQLLPDDYDLVISSHHSVAKGVRTGKKTLHICYCHTPMRYIWDQFDQYFAVGQSGITARMGARIFRGYLQRWDIRTAGNPDVYIANSRNTRERIERIYRRDSKVIYPPVDVSSLKISREEGSYFLVAGALVPYKRVDLVIQAFKEMPERLLIAGDGPARSRLLREAGPNIEFRGHVGDEALRDLYAGCRALIFPGVEDFGIIPVEAMASGKPVIAYAKGGALETVVDGVTGVLFQTQTAEGVRRALARFHSMSFDPVAIREHARKFDREVFKAGMSEYVTKKWAEFASGLRPK